MISALIAIEQTAYSFDKLYSYLIPENLKSRALAGCRVIIPFGKGNSKRQGIILSFEEIESAEKLKFIEAVIDSKPILNDEMLKMCEWMHEHIFCTYFDAVSACLPTGVNFKVKETITKGDVPFEESFQFLESFFNENPVTSKDSLLELFDTLNEQKLSYLISSSQLKRSGNAVRRMGDNTQKTVRPLVLKDGLDAYKLSAKQKEVAELICDFDSVSVKEILYFTGVSISVINTLEKKGIVEIYEKEVYRSPIKDIKQNIMQQEISLTDEQNAAYNRLLELYKSKKGEAALLYGVTGSGKTSVFLKLVDEAYEENKGAIIMVPEIALTPQMISIFSKRYGSRVAVFHSALSLGQRMDEWKRVKNGDASIVIGTRSAVFAPVENLSLIVIDEEQEHTYKSEKSPRFHARDLAKFRVSYNNALLVLASATPSLESYSAALSGKYELLKLSARYGEAVLPEVKTVDMRREMLGGNVSVLSRELNIAIYEALEAGNQAIVLLNRRGHNTYISCHSCGYVASCPNCSVSMTYHSANRRIMCHYCGYSEAVKDTCPSCSVGKLSFMGIGTQRVEQELKATFPRASVLRLDADTTSSRDSFSKLLGDFANGKYDIMLGTQMVAKGLDFPNVTVVGVLGADSAMNGDDYRSFERSFSLLTQVFGRAGRGNEKGIAVIQTNDPESNLIKLAATQDYESFYKNEILIRKMTVYPPYCDIVQIGVQSAEQQSAKAAAYEIFENITRLVKEEFSDIKLIILGPAVAAVPKVSNNYRFRLIIKTKNSKRLRELLRKSVDIKLRRDISLFIDINPERII
ncbi:MAG: primosomal protein N' [Clostridia bacterium]|nr:primosomal protein N' [Clostridia bacterium]